jgi:long-chain acyl-CoA synthetase
MGGFKLGILVKANMHLIEVILNLTHSLLRFFLAEVYPNGSITIIDRKKNLVKLQHGEYIALERLESVYKSCHYVANLCIYADSQQSYPVAIVYPVPKEIVHLAKSAKVPMSNHDDQHALEEVAENQEIKNAVLQSLQDLAKQNKLKPAEIVQKVHICTEEWTPQNGLLTAAQKLKRREIKQKYADAIKKMYA